MYRLIALNLSVVFLGCWNAPCPLYPHTEPKLALHQNALMRSTIRSIRATARADQWGREGRTRGTILMFVERPDRVRFDVMTQFGPAAILTSEGDRFCYSDLKKGKYFQGLTCPRNIERLLGVRMLPQKLIQFLLGGTPVLEDAEGSIQCTDGAYRISLKAPSGHRQEVDLAVEESDLHAPKDKQRLHLLRSEMYASDGRTLWRVTYSDYQPIPTMRTKALMPMEVRIEQPTKGMDIKIWFKEMEINPIIPSSAFTQNPRPGITEQTLQCE